LEQNKDPKSIVKEGTSWQHPTLGDVRSKSWWITHKDGIQWSGYSGPSHEGSCSYMKIFETCVKSLKLTRRVSPHNTTPMMCGMNKGIVKRRCKPPIIEDCLLSTPRDHSRWKARRLRYKLTSQDTFAADNIPLIYLWFIYNSMPCSYDNHDRLECL
jgi:hypothetical protein